MKLLYKVIYSYLKQLRQGSRKQTMNNISYRSKTSYINLYKKFGNGNYGNIFFLDNKKNCNYCFSRRLNRRHLKAVTIRCHKLRLVKHFQTIIKMPRLRETKPYQPKLLDLHSQLLNFKPGSYIIRKQAFVPVGNSVEFHVK